MGDNSIEDSNNKVLSNSNPIMIDGYRCEECLDADVLDDEALMELAELIMNM